MRRFVNRLKEGGKAIEPPIKATPLVAKGREEKRRKKRRMDGWMDGT